MKNVAIQDLVEFLPKGTSELVAGWINEADCQFRIAPPRKSKRGDYRPPSTGGRHRISVNRDLNPYAFLLTTAHEFAHLRTWRRYRDSVKPHGREWQSAFRELMKPLLESGVFPPALRCELTNYLERPAASTCSDLSLYRALMKFDQVKQGQVLEDVMKGAIFHIRGGRRFVKGEKLRKRFKCMETSSGKTYLFHPLCEVTHVNGEP